MKKFIKYFILVLTICSIFTLSVFANAVDADNVGDWYVVGAPSTLITTTTVNDTPYVVSYNEVNQYLKGLDANDNYTPNFSNRFLGVDSSTFRYDHNPIGVADILQIFATRTQLNSLSMYEPMYITNITTSRYWYAYTFGVYKPHRILTAEGNEGLQYYTELPVTHTYTVLDFTTDDEGVQRITTYVYNFEHTYPVISDWAYVPNITNNDLNTIVKNHAHFGRPGNEYAIIMSAHLSFPNTCYTEQVYYEPDPNTNRTTYTQYINHQRTCEAIVIAEGDIILDVDEFDMTSWVTNSVKSFMNFQLIPGLSIAGVLAILLGIPLLVWFLRLFAGG